MLLRRAVLVLVLLAAAPAAAQRDTTRDALDRLEEILALRVDDGVLDRRTVLPTLLVGARPMYEESQVSFPARALTTLIRAFGADGIRLCEACMQPRTVTEGGRLIQTSGPIGLDEIVRLDDRYRGGAERARTAIWIDETREGVALRIVDLRTARVVFARNVDPLLVEQRTSARNFTLAAELERRSRAESLTHAFVDVGLYPGQHFSLEWADQWGDTNANLTGIVLSFYDPVLGLGAGYGRVMPWADMVLGVKGVLSIPTLVAQSQADSDIELIDPLFNAIFTMRVPFGNSNYGALVTVSTNGRVALGLSLLNTSLIPVLP